MKIALIAPAGAPVQMPSLALTKIKGMLDNDFNNIISSDIIYLNFEFRDYLEKVSESFSNGEIGIIFIEFIFSYLAFNLEADENEVRDKLQYIFGLQGKQTDEIFEKIAKLSQFIDYLFDKYELDKYDVIGITVVFSILPAIGLINWLKKKKPGILIVVGGTMVYREQGVAWIKENSNIDYVVSGPGINAFKKLIQCLLNKDSNNLHKISGLISKDNFETVELVGEEIDINSELRLDYTSFVKSFYSFKIDEIFKPRLLLELSRGCKWGKCKFCQHMNFDANNQIQNNNMSIYRINEMFDKHGDISIHLPDAYILKSTLKNILPKINTTKKRSILFHTKANLDDEVFQLMSDAHVTIIDVGIESLSTSILKLMEKGSTAFHNLKILKLSYKHGILINWGYLYGIPGMTDEMYIQAISDIPKFYHLFPPTGHCKISFLRWSTYWENPKEYGLILAPNPIYNLIINKNSKTFINDIALRFVDTNTSPTGVNQLLKKYSSKLNYVLDEWIKKWETNEVEEIPKLYIYKRDGYTYIHDSRYNSCDEYILSKDQFQILTFLEEPNNLEDLYKSFNFTHEYVDNIISELYSKGLIFRESRKYYNLVFLDYNEDLYNIYIYEKKFNQANL